MFAFFAYYVNLDIYFTQNNPLFQAKIQKNHEISYKTITIYNLFIFKPKYTKIAFYQYTVLGYFSTSIYLNFTRNCRNFFEICRKIFPIKI